MVEYRLNYLYNLQQYGLRIRIIFNMKSQQEAPELLDALIIGAGFSGLYQLYCLREKLGLKVKVLEAGSGVGGTWFWNRYPGARCDSESHVYCYTFSKELTNDWNWSERYPGPTEIVSYLNHVADRFQLHSSIEFESHVVAARYDETNNYWNIDKVSDQTVHQTTHQTIQARFLITAVGCLSSANVPDIQGLDKFSGQWYHTGKWPHQGVNFNGKRVAQIGTGSTGIQAAPVIARSAEHLTIFQRTANYSVPARNRPLTDDERSTHKLNASAIRELTRSNGNGHAWRVNQERALETSAPERNDIYEKAWLNGGLRFRASFSDLLNNADANQTAARFIKDKIRQVVKDPDTASALADIDHPYAAKRPPIDTNYFESFNRSNVDLVDLRKTPIARIDKDGIVCSEIDSNEHHSEQFHKLDIIVFATGYDAITGPLLRLNIQGRDNLKLEDAWSAGPRNNLGLQVSGFPNLFMITGPGSPCVLTNMPAAIEQHVEWISDCIAYMVNNGHTTIESPESSVDNWVETVNTEADKTLLPSVKHSWYLGANIPGKPRVFMPYAGGLDKYRNICNAEASNEYDSFLII